MFSYINIIILFKSVQFVLFALSPIERFVIKQTVSGKGKCSGLFTSLDPAFILCLACRGYHVANNVVLLFLQAGLWRLTGPFPRQAGLWRFDWAVPKTIMWLTMLCCCFSRPACGGWLGRSQDYHVANNAVLLFFQAGLWRLTGPFPRLSCG